MPRSLLSTLRVLCALAAVAAASTANAAVIYVNANLAGGLNNGSSWANAYRGPQALATALTAATAGDQIWVASGRYIPGLTRASTFQLKNSVALYGGFAGGETLLDQRNIAANVAALTGDILNDDAPFPSNSGWDDNCYHVVTGSARDANAVLDGFTVGHSFANGGSSGDFDRGGGIICTTSGGPTFRNLRILNNEVNLAGAGAYINGSSPTFTDCTFEANAPSSGGSFGGGCAVTFTGNPTFLRCRFIANTARRGGAVDIFGNCQISFINCAFAANTATGSVGGGAVSNFSNSGAVSIINCTIVGNSTSPGNGAGVFTTSGGPVNVRNSIVHSNSGPGGATTGHQLFGPGYQTTYSCVQGGYAGEGNIMAAPTFVDAPNRDFRPQPGSPVIDAARNADYPNPAPVEPDLLHQPRFTDDPATSDTGAGTPPIIDMGAHEFQPAAKPVCPDVSIAPATAQLCRNQDFTLTAVPSGAVTGYQWRRSAVDIPGETGPTLELTDVSDDDEGAYTVVAFAAGCAPTESTAAAVVVCITDADCNDVINSTDVSEFINLWFADLANGTTFADFDENGTVNSTDVSNFINAWFTESSGGC